jgi:hypothetical protein
LAQTQEARFANFLPATLPEMQWLRRVAELFRSSKFGRNYTRALFEQEQINLFAECVRD